VKCRFCSAEVDRTFLDLGMQPLSNAYVHGRNVDDPELFYPLHARVCDRCLLVQLPETASAESIFTEYAYLSSTSASWVAHAAAFAREAKAQLGLTARSRVVEIASNDGYLLKEFVRLGVPVLGVEPAKNVAEIARREGVDTVADFFGLALARHLVATSAHADLVVANNVLAHVPDLNDFVRGLATLVAPEGTVSLEFPHLARLLSGCQFDTIYHEHFSYFSLGTAMQVLAAHGLEVFDVTELPTHGGSLRLSAARRGASRTPSSAVARVLAEEEREGARSLARYEQFAKDVTRVKREILGFLLDEQARGNRVAAYGAPAKGNTLLNFIGAGRDVVEFTVDKNPLKQGTLLPGTRIPVHAPEHLATTRPNVILILPWNLEREIVSELDFTREWGARLVVPVPSVRVVS
jgi:SAM-dependent methyltransferase